MLTRTEFLKLAMSMPLWAGEPPSLTPEEIEKYQRARAESIRPPIACVFKDKAATFYSSAVNGIACWADVGPVTWLGTRFGVKRVEKGQPTRHYTYRDGLPNGNITTIVADKKGVFVLVTVAEQESLYSLSSKSDRWEQLASWPLKKLSEQGEKSAGLLALNQKVVIAAPRIVDTGAGALFCFDRESARLRQLPCNTTIRNQVDRLLISFLSCQEKTALLGTNAGLLELPLSAEGGPWKRHLKDFSVTRGAEGAKRLYLWLDKQDPGNIPATLKDTGKPHWVNTDHWEAKALPVHNPYSQYRAIVDSAGALWLVYPQTEGLNPLFFNGPGNDAGTFFCWQP